MAHLVASGPVPEGENWARSALTRLGRLPGVHRAGLALAEGGGRRLLFTASDRGGNGEPEWCEVDVYQDVPLNHTVRTGEPVVGSLHDLTLSYGTFAGRQASQTQALASVPVLSAGQVQGAYVLFFDTPQPFDPDQLSQLSDLGTELGTGLRRLQRATVRESRSLRDQVMPEGALVARYTVDANPHEVSGARYFVRGMLRSWDVDEETIDDLVLCLSELVTNALLHTDAGCELSVMLDREVLTTTVRDGGSAVVVDPRNVSTDPLAVHGRGMQLVEALSTRWGSELDAGGMTVWFVVEPVVSPLAAMANPVTGAAGPDESR